MADGEISALKEVMSVRLRAQVETGYDPVTGREKTAYRSLPQVGNDQVSALDALRSLTVVMNLQKNRVLNYQQIDTNDLKGSKEFWDKYE